MCREFRGQGSLLNCTISKQSAKFRWLKDTGQRSGFFNSFIVKDKIMIEGKAT